MTTDRDVTLAEPKVRGGLVELNLPPSALAGILATIEPDVLAEILGMAERLRAD
jgi:hypothetical protein